MQDFPTRPVTQGNQSWVAVVPPERLAAAVINPFATASWAGNHAPISRQSVLVRVAAGDVLAPIICKDGMGGRVRTVRHHGT